MNEDKFAGHEPAPGPLFVEPFDVEAIARVLGQEWNMFPAHNWWRVFASRANWEDSAFQLARLYPVWNAAGLDPFLLHRLFHWLVDIATEYSDDEAEPMVQLLVRAVGRVPINPDPREEGYSAPRSLDERAEIPKRGKISKALRFSVLQRDGFACRYCGARPPAAVLQCDHIKPVAAGGKTKIENLITSCVDCNLGKGAAYDARVALLNKVRWAMDRDKK
jgi:hypothetical protein